MQTGPDHFESGLKVKAKRAETPPVDVTSSSALQAMAAAANDGLGTMVLKKALDTQAQSMVQLLQTLTPPQAENKGTIVDAQA